jgi:hypothetical protein
MKTGQNIGERMNQKKIERLLGLISDFVQETDGQSWRDKKDAILAEASDEDKTNLTEFCAWFEEA